MDDLISRQAAINAPVRMVSEGIEWIPVYHVEQLPSAQPKRTEERTETRACDLIDRQAALDAIDTWDKFGCDPDGKLVRYDDDKHYVPYVHYDDMVHVIKTLPSAQPERTCVNCGRTANNGGWYADGRTRCPIEEHYALPKDGYCHLWEKRNVTDDDYPERREE